MYPALEIKRGVSVTPIETYVSWNDHYVVDDCKLICLYHLRDDDDFKRFENTKLLNNKLFCDFKQVEENKGVYVFDFKNNISNWNSFITGSYSKFTPEHKKIIKNYIGANSSHAPYIDSFLNPDTYFKMYAEMMDVNESLLRSVGELCSLPNLESETLNISVKKLEYTQEKH